MQGVEGLWDVDNACLTLDGSYKDLCLKIFVYLLIFSTCVVIFHNKKKKKQLPREEKN